MLIGASLTALAVGQPISELPLRCEPTSEFALPRPGAFPNAIVEGPDGNLWFSGYPGIGRITTSGAVSLIPIEGSTGTRALAFDLEGNLWFAEDQKIGRLSTDGLIAEFILPAGGRPAGIALGPDDEIWFTDTANQRIGRITPSGSISEIQLSAYPSAITTGPDGNLWLTESGDQIARLSPSGSVTEFPIPGQSNPYSSAVAITSGPDGALWFTEPYGVIGRITTTGVISLVPIPRFQLGETVGGITSGPDGNLWFAESVTPLPFSPPTAPLSKIGRITPQGAINQFSLPTTSAIPTGITAGPDGNLWVTEFSANQIAKVSSLRPCTRFTTVLPFR